MSIVGRRLRKMAMALGALVVHACSGGGAPGEVTPESAFTAERSGVWMEFDARVTRLLADDNKGSRHQRFIVRRPSGQTVLIVHNIDLAPRVRDLDVGSRVRIRGEYEWNERGGLMHWTHHDPDGDIEGGWVEYAGRTYR